MAENDEADQRLVKLKRDQRARVAGERALKDFLCKDTGALEDKLASVRTTHRIDKRRVLSAVRHFLDRDHDN